MAKPLKKKKKNGDLYVRPAGVEQIIDEALKQTLAAVQERANLADPDSPGYVPSECLVHLIRDAICRKDDTTAESLIRILFARCERLLKAKGGIPDGSRPDASDLRDEVLSRLGRLFAYEGTAEDKRHLDFYECRFNRALKTLQLSVRRDANEQSDRLQPLPQNFDSQATPDDDRFAHLSRLFSTASNQQIVVQVREAMEALTPDEHEAVALVHVMGYEVESEDPEKETAATRAGVSGRTIRSRLARAAATIAKFTEDKS